MGRTAATIGESRWALGPWRGSSSWTLVVRKRNSERSRGDLCVGGFPVRRDGGRRAVPPAWPVLRADVILDGHVADRIDRLVGRRKCELPHGDAGVAVR